VTELYKVENPEKRYDSFAPKFVYKRKVGAFSRKTTKTPSKTKLELMKDIKPSFKKKDRLFPKTKPMIDWERIYVGGGRAVGKGRPTSSKGISLIEKGVIEKPPKRKFVPFIDTYKTLEEGRKYGSYKK
jgi:hypothetical protein